MRDHACADLEGGLDRGPEGGDDGVGKFSSGEGRIELGEVAHPERMGVPVVRAHHGADLDVVAELAEEARLVEHDPHATA